MQFVNADSHIENYKFILNNNALKDYCSLVHRRLQIWPASCI
jgi:hypothetical protein